MALGKKHQILPEKVLTKKTGNVAQTKGPEFKRRKRKLHIIIPFK
jgi:hypothetical protein